MSEDARKLVEEFDKSPKWNIIPRNIQPAFGDYLSRNAGFVDYLSGVRDQIETYVNRLSVKRPLNVLLAAPPGNGKSFLIKELIGSVKSDLKIAFEEVYVASLESIPELYSVFQRVQSINLEGKIPAIFFDEIDSPIGGATIYAKFLAPMWDGTFYIGKEKFFLGKSVFFFAGSTLSMEEESTKILIGKNNQQLSYDEYFDKWKARFDKKIATYKDKLPDFMDRIDATIRIPPVRAELLGKDWILEHEDIACMMVRKHFPKVKLIGKHALKVLCDQLVNGNSLRTAEKIVFNSRLADPETFEISCLPRKYKNSGTREDTVFEILTKSSATAK